MQLKLLLHPDRTNAKPAGVLSARTTHECNPAVESCARPSLPHCGHLRFSIHRLRTTIPVSPSTHKLTRDHGKGSGFVSPEPDCQLGTGLFRPLVA